jgi:hypothetical protein
MDGCRGSLPANAGCQEAGDLPRVIRPLCPRGGRALKDMALEELDALWEEAKKGEN